MRCTWTPWLGAFEGSETGLVGRATVQGGQAAAFRCRGKSGWVIEATRQPSGGGYYRVEQDVRDLGGHFGSDDYSIGTSEDNRINRSSYYNGGSAGESACLRICVTR